MRNNKGFTLVEMVICVALISFVMLGLGTMLMSATKNNTYVYNQSTVHQNAELSITAMRTRCIEASQVYAITNSSGSDAMKETGEIELGEIVISRAVIDDKTWTPKFDKVYYKFDKTARTFSQKIEEHDKPSGDYAVIATNIDSVRILPLCREEASPAPGTASSSKDFKNCVGIEVHFSSVIDDKAIKKKAEANIESQFYFKNTKYRE